LGTACFGLELLLLIEVVATSSLSRSSSHGESSAVDPSFVNAGVSLAFLLVNTIFKSLVAATSEIVFESVSLLDGNRDSLGLKTCEKLFA